MELITISTIRIFAHMELLGIFVALGILAYIARGTTIPISFHFWYLFAGGIFLLSVWVIGLILSVGPSPWIPRAAIVPALVFLEFSGATFVWSGLVLTFKRCFKIAPFLKRDVRQGVL